MVIDLCSCDWGLGAPLPPHEHATLLLLRREGSDRTMWIRGTPSQQTFDRLPYHGFEIVAEVEELFFVVPWKVLAREALVSV